MTYILVVKGTIILAGVVLTGLGIYLLSKKANHDFEFSISLLEKLSTNLKGKNAGLLFVLLGCILMISTMLITMEVEVPVKIEEVKIPKAKDLPIRNEDDVFGNTK